MNLWFLLLSSSKTGCLLQHLDFIERVPHLGHPLLAKTDSRCKQQLSLWQLCNVVDHLFEHAPCNTTFLYSGCFWGNVWSKKTSEAGRVSSGHRFVHRTSAADCSTVCTIHVDEMLTNHIHMQQKISVRKLTRSVDLQIHSMSLSVALVVDFPYWFTDFLWINYRCTVVLLWY